MGVKGEPSLNFKLLVDPEPMPSDVPQVEEIGASSAPLLSASFFIGARCRPYNDDFMACKEQSSSKEVVDCLKEGRRVTRCAASVIEDINKHCADSFRLHWQCLNNNNHELFKCRKAEVLLNKCVFDNLKLVKHISGTDSQIHLKKNPIFTPSADDRPSILAYREAKKEGKI